MVYKFKVLWSTRMNGQAEAEFLGMQVKDGWQLVTQVFVPGGPTMDDYGPEFPSLSVDPALLVYKSIYRKV